MTVNTQPSFCHHAPLICLTHGNTVMCCGRSVGRSAVLCAGSLNVLCSTEKAHWLTLFVNHPATQWDGVCLSSDVVSSKRQLIRRAEASLIDLRNYLFARQCHILLQLQRPAEICQRSVPFIHNCIKELSILKVHFIDVVIFCRSNHNILRLLKMLRVLSFGLCVFSKNPFL